MCPLPNTPRPTSSSKTSGEAGSASASFGGKDYYQELIGKANSVPIIKLFKLYGIHLDTHSRKITCPLKSHAGGRERSPSFWYYPETNTFHCFGCHKGPSCCDFVAEMDRCTKVQAAYKILQLFGSDVDVDNIYDPEDAAERLEIMIDFSSAVREFYQTYPSEEAGVYVEMICEGFDKLNSKHKSLDNDALRRAVERAKEFISLHK